VRRSHLLSYSFALVTALDFANIPVTAQTQLPAGLREKTDKIAASWSSIKWRSRMD
jgi:hypothetical protein